MKKNNYIIGFCFMDGCIFVKFYLILVYMHPLAGGGGGGRVGLSPRKM